MATELDPIVGHWYRHLDKGQTFVVVGLDEEEETVEIQHFDGDVEELDLRAWFEMDLETAVAPEDWTGPLDDVEIDDTDYTDTAMSAEDWREPLQEIRSEEEWQSTQPEDERDEWSEGALGEDVTDEDAFPGGELPEEPLERSADED